MAFAANTAVIVLLQLPVVNRIQGRRRTRLLMLLAADLGDGLGGRRGRRPGRWGARRGPADRQCRRSSAVGETLQSPVVPAVVNDLASERLRGRYNATNSLAFQIAAVLGPTSAGLLIGHGLAAAYIVMLLVGCAVLVVLLLAWSGRISPAANGVG